MNNHPLPRLDKHPELLNSLRAFCRVEPGSVWVDPLGRHRVACMDAANPAHVGCLMEGQKAALALQDPPYNLVAFAKRELDDYIVWCSKWVQNTDAALAPDSSLYVWLGADQNDGFQPLPDFMLMMRRTRFQSRSFVTMRNQRGFGTSQNWMAVRQELLFYRKGNPLFNVEAEYTDIPKVLRGYYKEVNGRITENLERSNSDCIRAGNVWVDIQQVFYRMEENVSGCYAQKPLKSAERILRASSSPGDLVLDFFCHSGTTLLAAERFGRHCCTMDIEPVFCEIAIRRLERYRRTGKTGWQNGNPFEAEITANGHLQDLVGLVRDEAPERELAPF